MRHKGKYKVTDRSQSRKQRTVMKEKLKSRKRTANKLSLDAEHDRDIIVKKARIVKKDFPKEPEHDRGARLKRQMQPDSDSGSSSETDSDSESRNTELSVSLKQKSCQTSASRKRKTDPSEEVSSESDVSEGDGEDNIAEGEKEEETEYDALKKEIANMPFDELQKLKERVGSKVYYQALFGTAGAQGGGKKRIYKRANKNRPMEMTSKAPVPRYRQMQAKKALVTRDPRFDDLSGEYDEKLFKQSYGFIDDVKTKEKKKLQMKLKKEKDPEKRVQISYLVNRMTQQEKSTKEKEKRQEKERELRKKEKEMVQEGKTPFYLKKSERRKLELAEKFKELKKSGKLNNYMNRKRKKVASKDRRNLPNLHTKF